MKVLTIREPYATLIMKAKKKIETRSFKTNYRGVLYIHASSYKDSSLNEEEYNFGHIICKVNLIDCVYMTEEYVLNMKNNNKEEYDLGNYQVGRYAWVLEDVEVVSKIKVKGKLGIWNYGGDNYED